jgi:hypothetical protein
MKENPYTDLQNLVSFILLITAATLMAINYLQYEHIKQLEGLLLNIPNK